MILEVLLGLCGLALTLWAYGSWCHRYWARVGVSTPPAKPLLGHVHHVFSSTRAKWEWRDEAYRRHGGRSLYGLYNFLTPQLLVGDPVLLKDVLVRDFQHFVDRRHLTLDGEDQLWSDMLSNASGDRWRRIRAAVTPAFTSGRLKAMFPLIAEKAQILAEVAASLAGEGDPVEVKALFGRFSMDATASCAFGLECDSLNGNNNEFCRQASVIMNPTLSRIIKITAFYLAPRVCHALGMRLINDSFIYFAKMATEVMNQRMETGQRRGDFIDLLIEARKVPDDSESQGKKHALDDVSLLSQCIVFLLSGYDNNASALAFCCYFLARHQHLQEKAREEVKRLREEHGGQLSYDAIADAKYLDACLSETLRFYPIETGFDRLCVKDYKLGDTGVVVPEGMVVEVPVWSLHRDPSYWEDPEEFRPERFLPENKERILPYTYLPFGVGPRSCIGQRFTYLEVKAALAFLLEKVSMTPAPGHEGPPRLAISPIILRPKDGIRLVFHPIKE